MQLIIIFAALLSLFFVAFTNAQTQQVQGDSHCGDGYCFSAIYSPTTKMINYTLIVPKGGQQIGWYGIAQGKEMEGANMAINWINVDNSLTTSHRSSPSMIMPLTSAVTIKEFSLNQEIQKTQFDQSIWSWNMPMTKDPLNAVQHVFAFCPTTPSTSSIDAIIVKHIRHDTGIVLDLTKNYDASAIPNNESSSMTGSSINLTSVANEGSSGMDTSAIMSMPMVNETSNSTPDEAGTTAANATGTSVASGQPKNNAKKNSTRSFLVYLILTVVAWQLCFL